MRSRAVLAEQVRVDAGSTKRFGRVVLCLIVAMNVLGGALLWHARAQAISTSAAADLHARLAVLQPLISTGDFQDPTLLHQIGDTMGPIQSDLSALESAIPFGGSLPFGSDGAEHHALAMASDMALAAKDSAAAEQTLLPAFQALEASALGATTGSASAGTQDLTLAEIAAAQASLDPAKAAMANARAEWAHISPKDQAALEQSAYGPFISLMSTMGDRLNNWLQLESAVLDWSPSLLGMQWPSHLLLVLMDSNIPRPTGGAITHYGLITLDGGKVEPGVHLQSVAQLDCPSGVCPSRALPSNYQWMPLTPTRYGLGFANIDPDFTVSAWSIFNAFTQEGGPKVDGIIAITPEALAGALEVVGPVYIPQLDQTVTAKTLLSLMRQYDDLGLNGQHVGLPDFDALLFQTLGARLAHLDAQQQAAVWHGVGADLATKDVQVYAFNDRTESGIAQLGFAANLPRVTQGDDLAIVNTSLDDAPIASSIAVQASDTITLDNNQGAQHTLALTYHYVATPGAAEAPYDDLVRVIVADGATQTSISGPCEPLADAANVEAYRTTLACTLELRPGHSATVTFTWYAPDVLNNTGVPTYSLLLERQAGQSQAIQVRVSAPSGQSLSQPQASVGSATAIDGGDVAWSTSALAQDTMLSVGLR